MRPLIADLTQGVRAGLISDVLEAAPLLHRGVQSVRDDSLHGFQSFHQTAFAGTVIADKDGKRREANDAAVTDGLEIFEAEGLQR